jgi:uncharacterized protein with NAD-binding domain and iron-sulfur cluster
MRTGVRRLSFEGNRVTGAQLDDGSIESADFVISAVPHEALLELLPENTRNGEPVFQNLAKLAHSPITGVHFWFDRNVMDEPFLTLLGQTTQWVFNKSLLYSKKGDPATTVPSAASSNAAIGEAQHLQLVISASRGLVPLSRQEIVKRCLAEICAVLPSAREATLVKSVVIKEAQATFSPGPGCDQWRPHQKSPVPGLFLAGDWTATGWPATMEGAVRSGYRAAECILAAEGKSASIVVPDLSPGPLAALLSRR